MIGIFSKLYHYAPPLLHRTFNLSNQSFSLILTKSPSFPPLSFLPQIPMASLLDHVRNQYPLSATALSFLREMTSPNSFAISADIPPTVSALSLMQMRREMEAEAGVCPALQTNVKESESSAKEITGDAPAAALLPSPTPDDGREAEGDFILKLKEERRRELAALAERHPVSSRFPFQGRIQLLIRLRSLRQELTTIRRQQWSQKLETERFETRSNNFFLRERIEDEGQYDMNEVPIEESMKVHPSYSHVFVFAIPFDHSESEYNHFQELVSTTEIESSPQDFYSPQAFFTLPSQCEDQQENQSFDASWEEKSLLGSSLDWQRASDSHMLQTWHGEIASDETKTSTQDQYVESDECNWLLQPSNLRRG